VFGVRQPDSQEVLHVKPTLPLRRDSRRAALLAGAVLAIVAAPVALGFGEGSPIRGGARNPSSNAAFSYNGETQIIADNSDFGTRQSNKGTGGGAIYGCRSHPGGPACIATVNLNVGKAFSFTTAGSLGGTITVKDSTGAPFTTNGHGVATGLNANFLQGHQASDFQLASQPAANANQLGGQPASAYVQTTTLLFADVSGTGVLGAGRGAKSAARSTTNPDAYTVTFAGDITKCALAASPVGAALTTGQIGVAPDSANPDVVDVNTPAALGTGGFDLQVTC
jgi:hypothetical protein